MLLGFLDPSVFRHGQRTTSLGVPHSTVHSHVRHDDCIDGVHVAPTLWLERSCMILRLDLRSVPAKLLHGSSGG